MRKNCFDTLYQFFTKNAKCLQSNHYGDPIYYCSEDSCKKGYICSQCLTEDPEHFSNHVKNFIAIDTKKNFFRFLQIPIDNFEDSFTNNFILNSRNNFFINKEKINDSSSFYDYIKNQINLAINNNQKNNLLKDENFLDQYFNKRKGIKNKNNEYINNSINEFIKKNDKHQILNLMNKIKPTLNKKNNEVSEKDKLNDINRLISEEIPIIIKKCLNILCKLDNFDEINNNENENKSLENYNTSENKDKNSNEFENLKENQNNIKDLDEKKSDKNNNFINENDKKINNKIINVINDIKPIKNNIKILNIELNNNNNFNSIIDNHKSFYEGSINNISSIKTESNIETEEFESKININMNMNNMEINKNNNNSPPKNNKHPSVNDPFFNLLYKN